MSGARTPLAIASGKKNRAVTFVTPKEAAMSFALLQHRTISR
jgi:hypothetical protein